MNVNQTTHKTPAYLLWLGGSAFGILCLVFWVAMKTAERPTTIAEAEKALSALYTERGFFGRENEAKCAPKPNFVFKNAADFIAALEKPASLGDARKQLDLINQLGHFEFDHINNICQDGRQAETNAVNAVTYNVDALYSSTEAPLEDEVFLLNNLAGNNLRGMIKSKARLAKRGCFVEEDGGFLYSCKE